MNMGPLGYQEGGELPWWWRVALKLDEAQGALANAMAHNLDDQTRVFELLWWWSVAQKFDEAQGALANAMAHNLDDQTRVFALQDKLCEAQGILLGILEMKGLVAAAVRAPAVPEVS